MAGSEDRHQKMLRAVAPLLSSCEGSAVPSPYRETAQAKTPEPKSGELVYQPQERIDRIAAGHSGFRLFAIPTLAGAIVGNFWAVEAGVVAFFMLLGGFAWWSRKRPKDVVLLHVSDGELRVFPMGSNRETFRVRLDELDDVVLETKSVERILDVGANAVNIGMGALAPNIASPTETKRIALESSRGAHSLTSQFFGHAETMEWFAAIRRFLRSAGWTPLSERGEEEQVDEEMEEGA